ncbi:condensation domain-containing protein [Streptomyces sp. JNUCC 63]
MADRETPRPEIKQVDRCGYLPVSFTQEERLRFGREIHLPNHLIAFGLLVTGSLSTSVLARAVRRLLERHEGLLLNFPEMPGEPRFGICAPSDVDLRVVSVSGPGTDAQALDRAVAVVARMTDEPFDLGGEPLFRITAVRIDDHQHLIGIVLDHVIVDGMSTQILVRDLLTLYQAECDGTRAQLPPIPLQFVDYAAWERARLDGPGLASALAYWRSTLAGIDPIPGSGLVDPDMPAQGAGAPALGVESRPLDIGLYSGIKRTARTLRATPYMVISAALKTVIRSRRLELGHTEDAASDVAIMGSLANRTHQGIAQAIGYFATPCVLRTDLAGAATLAELVGRERSTVLGALEHQDVPHALITRELNPAQYGLRQRFGTVEVPRYVNFEISGGWEGWIPSLNGLQVEPVPIPMPEIPRGGIRVIVHDLGTTARVDLRLRTDFYGKRWARHFLADLTAVLRRMVDAPESTPAATP